MFVEDIQSVRKVIIKLLPVLQDDNSRSAPWKKPRIHHLSDLSRSKDRDNAYLRSRLYFYEETVLKAVFAACQSKHGFFESDWPTAVEVSRTLAWLAHIQILLDRLSMQRESSDHVVLKARQFRAI